EDCNAEDPVTHPEAAAAPRAAEDRDEKAQRALPPLRHHGRRVRQVALQLGEVGRRRRVVRRRHALRELLEREPSLDEVLAQRRDGTLAVGIGDADDLVHGASSLCSPLSIARMTSPQPRFAHATGTRQRSMPTNAPNAYIPIIGVPGRGGTSFPFASLWPKTMNPRMSASTPSGR